MTRHFLSLADHPAEWVERILAQALELKRLQRRGVPHRYLEGQSLACVFEKASTRTRVSFEIGMAQLGGHALVLTAQGSQMGRGEPIKDTARVLSGYVDAVMIRTFSQTVLEELAAYATVPVINGLTDLLHPCQLLADLMTIVEEWGSCKDRAIAWIGDGNNMANSWLNAAALLGFELRLACPEGFDPDPDVLARAKEANPRIALHRDPLEAARGAEVLTTDVWSSMGQEDEAKARMAAFDGFCLDGELASGAAPHHIVLHCLPAHRGEEISDDVIEGPHSRVFQEAENRLHAQKALLVDLLTQLPEGR